LLAEQNEDFTYRQSLLKLVHSECTTKISKGAPVKPYCRSKDEHRQKVDMFKRQRVRCKARPLSTFQVPVQDPLHWVCSGFRIRPLYPCEFSSGLQPEMWVRVRPIKLDSQL
jgi:hypothetical protein